MSSSEYQYIELLQWISQPEVGEWVRGFLPNLVPTLQQIQQDVAAPPIEPFAESGGELDQDDPDSPV